MSTARAYKCAAFFDGDRLHQNVVLCFGAGRLEKVTPPQQLPPDLELVDLGDTLVSPGYADLQVNGGGGTLLNDDPSVHGIEKIAAAHWQLGVRHLLPTLITDTPEKTKAAINAAIAAIGKGVPGIAGLHLEGPHLAVARKGAHVGTLIRPMTQDDLDLLVAAAEKLPAFMVTIAPENTSLEQVQKLTEAGAIVSLGHTDAGFETCMEYADAGAGCMTHLFNAMSQMGSREPGAVGAGLASNTIFTGIIADGIHVHPEMLRVAWEAKRGNGKIFLVSDAMSVAGTDIRSFDLCGRKILRSDGKLTLEDGTLAGADLDLTTAVQVLVKRVGVPLAEALAAATKTPLELITRRPFSAVGMSASDFICLSPDLEQVTPLA